MNIPTENIDEWCFRYLEKDLNEEECSFFEKELSVNSDLALELNKWKKTFLTNKDELPGANAIEHTLYRFKHQIALLLAESILVLGICSGIFVYTTKETALPVFNTSPVIIESAKPSCIAPANKRKGSFILNEQTKQIKAEKADNTTITTNIEPIAPVQSVDSVSQSDTSVTPVILENTAYLKTIKDSSQFIKKPKASTKKSNVKRNYPNGSRVIPLNNDL